MALTIGTGPFATGRDGHFDVEPPRIPLNYWEPFPKRLRVMIGGETAVDSRNVIAWHQTGKIMRLCVPLSEVRREILPSGSFEQPVPAALKTYLSLNLEKLDTWYLENELGYAHPRDPYHRVDVHHSDQHVLVRVGQTTVAETSTPAILFETSLAPRYYFSPAAIRPGLLQKSETVSRCPYKGDGQHWHVVVDGRRIVDAVWNLTTPMDDALLIPRWFSFYAEKVDLEVDGEKISH